MVSTVTMASLLELSHELLHCIFASIEPRDIAALSLSCRSFHAYIRGNRLLHREIFIQRYDELLQDDHQLCEDELHERFRLEQLLESHNVAVKRQSIDLVTAGISKLMETASPQGDKSRNIKLLSEAFKDRPDNCDIFLCSSSLFAEDKAGNGADQIAASSSELRQASAKAHCLYGVPIDVPPRRSIFSLLQPDLTRGPSSCTRSQNNGRQPVTHPWARSKVYDLREYTDATLWGPFMNDGSHRVDWEKVEAVMIVLGHNLRKFSDTHVSRFSLVWKDTFQGASPGSYRSPSKIPVQATTSAPVPPFDVDGEMYKIRELALALDALDPYGVTGSWMRVVCFLDYNDLYAFNFAGGRIPEDQSRGPVDTEEGLIDLIESVRVLAN